MAATSIGAIRDFWKQISADAQGHANLHSTFASETKGILEKLSSEQVAFSDVRAVAVFLLQTGALQIEIQRAVDGFEYQKIVFAPRCEEQRAKEQSEKDVKNIEANDGKSTVNENQNLNGNLTSAEGRPYRPEQKRHLRIKLTKWKGSEKTNELDKNAKGDGWQVQSSGENDDFDVGGCEEDDDDDAVANDPSFSTKRMDSDLRDTRKGQVTGAKGGIVVKKEIDDDVGEDSIPVATEEPQPRSRRSTRARKTTKKFEEEDAETSIGVKRGGMQETMGAAFMHEIGPVESGDDDDDDVGGDDDYSDDEGEWKPDGDDKEIEKQDDADEERDENEGLDIAENSVTLVCPRCNDISYTTWDYDLHSVECTLAHNKTKYRCHLCVRRSHVHATKWGVVYHLITIHNWSGPDALAKLPELDVKLRKKKKRGKKEDMNEEVIGSDKDDDGEGGEVSKEEEQKDEPVQGVKVDEAREQGLLDDVVSNTLEQLFNKVSSEGKDDNDAQSDDPDNMTSGKAIKSDKICKICLKEFPSRHKAFYHTKKDHFGMNEEHKCSTCGKILIGLTRFRLHAKMHSDKGKGKIYSCKDCDKFYFNMASLANHRAVHTRGDRSFQCDKCDKKFRYAPGLARHINTAHKLMRNFQCDHCDKKYHYKPQLLRHMEYHTGKQDWKCEFCDKFFFGKSRLRSHVNYAHSGKTEYLCDLCGSVFKSQGILNTHRKTVHEKIQKFLCIHCGKEFMRSNRLKSHIRIHAEDWPYQCDICHVGYTRQSKFEKHFQSQHEGLKPLHCEFCGRLFLKEESLLQHKNKFHQGTEKYFCKVCGTGCQEPSQLKDHLAMTHNMKERVQDNPMEDGDQPAGSQGSTDATLSGSSQPEPRSKSYRLSLPGGITLPAELPGPTPSSSLPIGVAPYVYKFPYKCEECHQGFHLKYNYTLHMNEHKGIENISCQVCGWKLLSESGLKNHMLTKHPEFGARWECEICGFRSRMYTKYRRHMMGEHNLRIPKSFKEPRVKRRRSRKIKTETVDEDASEYAGVHLSSDGAPPEIMHHPSPPATTMEVTTQLSMVPVMVVENEQDGATMAILQLICHSQEQKVLPHL